MKRVKLTTPLPGIVQTRNRRTKLNTRELNSLPKPLLPTLTTKETGDRRVEKIYLM